MKKIIKTCLLVVLLISVFGCINYLALDWYTNKKINLVDVLVATHDIESREIIKEEDIKTIKIPSNYILDNVENDKDNILGKITSIQGAVPKDAMFYKSMLEDVNKIADTGSTKLMKNQVAYTLPNSDNSLVISTLVPEQKIDLYVYIEKRNEQPVFDCLFTSVRILSIKDRKGNEVGHKDNMGASMITLAVDEKHIPYLSLATKLGAIELYAPSNTYDKNQEATLNEQSKVLPYLKSNES